MNVHIERRFGERRSNIDRRRRVDHRYEEPEFHSLIEKRADRERRRMERRGI